MNTTIEGNSPGKYISEKNMAITSIPAEYYSLTPYIASYSSENLLCSEAAILIRCISGKSTGRPRPGTAPPRWHEKIDLLVIRSSLDNKESKTIIHSWEQHLHPAARIIIYHGTQYNRMDIIDELSGNLGNYKIERSTDDATVLVLDRCIHHWMIDRNEKGTCRLCGRTRDFTRMMQERNNRPRWAISLKSVRRSDEPGK